MARTGLRSKWPWRHGCLPMLCLTWLVVSDALSSPSFVNGVTWCGQRDAKQRVTERFGERHQSLPESTLPAGTVEKMAISLTNRITEAESAKGLIMILDEAVDGTIFNSFHASAAYSSLAKWKRGLQRSDWDSPGIDKLHGQVRDMINAGELSARQLANVLWSIGTLSGKFRVPMGMLDALVKFVPIEAKEMKPQELSNCLWACARLKAIAPSVLQIVGPIATLIIQKAKDMIPQHLSNCLWASAQLKSVAPDVLQAVPAIVAQVPDKAKDMIPQQLSNCLWATLQLEAVAPEVLEIVPTIVMGAQSKIKDMNGQALSNVLEAIVPLEESVPEVARLVADVDSEEDIIRSAAARLNILLPRLEGKDLVFTVPVIVWACAKLGLHDRQLMNSVAQRFGSRAKMSSLPAFGVCALSWSYQELDTQHHYTEIRELLGSEVARRGFSQADVESCRLGRSEWSGARRR